MTGVADLYLLLRRPHSKDARLRVKAFFMKERHEHVRFVVLSWKRSGTNLLCGILHNHPEITMHNELFNPIDIFTYHPEALVRNTNGDRWNFLGRDLWPEAFLDYIWSGKHFDGEPIVQDFKAVGFTSFPDHWTEARNEPIWQKEIMDDIRIKKIVLQREDELAVYISMLRAEKTGSNMTQQYPDHLKFYVDPHRFQVFVDNYRVTFRRKYKSPMEKRDTFRVTYEQLVDEVRFEADILPLLWQFLGVDTSEPIRKLRETIKQAPHDEDLASVIANYDELEFCFRHTDVFHFKTKPPLRPTTSQPIEAPFLASSCAPICLKTWSILLPICSRGKASQTATSRSYRNGFDTTTYNSNRLIDLAVSSQDDVSEAEQTEEECWNILRSFAESLQNTSSLEQLIVTECIVGIDIDDTVYSKSGSRARIRELLPCKAVFVKIERQMYGKVCKIWNHLARKANNDFIVLLGDDIVILDKDWQESIVQKFHEIAQATSLPLGAACVAINDLSFPGFPTFPVVHRWHINRFGSLLPKHFVNQGGDPYLYELYSRFNAAAFEVRYRLKNTVGGDGDARYKKHEINWRGQILRLNLIHLKQFLSDVIPTGVCLDVIVPSYRMRNSVILKRIALLRASVPAYVRFWFVLDNPNASHVQEVRKLVNELNDEQLALDVNYFLNVIEYGENRGASYARNIGYNYSTADWCLFLDDDVIPDSNLLDAYIGAIHRYPDSKVFVGQTDLPKAMNRWTRMLRTCNIMFFYGIAKDNVHPPWGVTANLLVRGSRHNPTIQFKLSYPKSGGGEDMDFVFQFKEWYRSAGQNKTVVGVPGAKAQHPWWNRGGTCYRQINGWAWGDSLCLTLWPDKTYFACPNWIEFIFLGILPVAFLTRQMELGCLATLLVTIIEHCLLCLVYLPQACQIAGQEGLIRSLWIAFGAGTIMSSQEATRFWAAVRRMSPLNVCRRFDWNDGQQPKMILDAQLRGFLRFVLNFAIVLLLVFERAMDRRSHNENSDEL
jgi:hypothetical protein